MITVFVGKDTIARQAEVATLLRGFSNSEVIRHSSGSELPILSGLANQSLFGGSAVHIFDHTFTNFSEEYIKSLLQVPVPVVIIEDSLDKRLTKVKDFLKHSAVTVKEFPLPDADTAVSWLITHARTLGVVLSQDAASVLANALLGSIGSTLSVTRAHQELQKLAAYADGKPVTVDMVTDLVVPEAGIDVFKLLDAIAGKRRHEAITLLDQYYASSGEDEKSSSIRLVALLADQWRNVAIVKDLSTQRIPDQEILKMTGWKSGRLYIMQKIARNYELKTILSALDKLSHLDAELKTSTLPGRIIVDMIIAAL